MKIIEVTDIVGRIGIEGSPRAGTAGKKGRTESVRGRPRPDTERR